MISTQSEVLFKENLVQWDFKAKIRLKSIYNLFKCNL